jgi:hypothetical protein
VENPAAGDFATQLSEIHMEMKDKLLEAQDRQKGKCMDRCLTMCDIV